MIEVVLPRDYAQYRRELADMHRLRHRVFKLRLGWDVASRNGLERDGYDDLQPIYLLGFDDDGVLRGTLRLLPTVGRYMLRDTFSELLDGLAPFNCPTVWEISRYAVEADYRSDNSLAAANRISSELFCGLVEFGLDRGIEQVLTVHDVRIDRLVRRIGCQPLFLSKPKRIGQTVAVYGRYDVSPAVLHRLRAAGAITGSVLATSGRTTDRQAA